MSSARDAEKEREIETSTDIKQLKAIRSSRKGQLTKLEKDVQHYFRTPLKDMKKHTLDGFLTTFEKQVNFYDLAHERILDLVQATVPAEYEYEEKMGEDQETRRQLEANHQALNLLQPDESLVQFLADLRIKWTHSPSRSPHFGGIWEAGVKVTQP